MAYVSRFHPDKKPKATSSTKQLTITLNNVACELNERNESIPEVYLLHIEPEKAKELVGIAPICAEEKSIKKEEIVSEKVIKKEVESCEDLKSAVNDRKRTFPKKQPIKTEIQPIGASRSARRRQRRTVENSTIQPLIDVIKKIDGVRMLNRTANQYNVWCEACWRVVIFCVGGETFEKFWTDHSNTAFHQEKKSARQKLQFDGDTSIPHRFGPDDVDVCQTLLITLEAWNAHKELSSHIQKAKVHSFIYSSSAFELIELKPASDELLQTATVPLLGKECIYEFHHEVVGFSFWICSLCCFGGEKINLLNQHLTSNSHRMAYVSRFHPDKKPKATSSTKQLTISLNNVACELNERNDSIPEVYLLHIEPEKAKELIGMVPICAATSIKEEIVSEKVIKKEIKSCEYLKSAVNDRKRTFPKKQPIKTEIQPIGTSRSARRRQRRTVENSTIQPLIDVIKKIEGVQMLNRTANQYNVWCEACWRVVIFCVGGETFENFWNDHSNTAFHQKKKSARQKLQFAEGLFVINAEPSPAFTTFTPPKSSLNWIRNKEAQIWLNTRHVVGLEYMIERYENTHDCMAQKSDIVCLLCAEILPADKENVEMHIFSEDHIEQFVHKKDPTKAAQFLKIPSANIWRNNMNEWLYEKRFPMGKMRVYNQSLMGLHKSSLCRREPGKARTEFVESLTEKYPLYKQRNEILTEMLNSDYETVANRGSSNDISIQKRIDNCQRPLIGQEFIVEIYHKVDYRLYCCRMCDFILPENEHNWMGKPISCLSHLCSASHRLSYLRKKFKSYADEFDKFQKSQQIPKGTFMAEGGVLANKLEEYAKIIEKSEGRKAIDKRLKLKSFFTTQLFQCFPRLAGGIDHEAEDLETRRNNDGIATETLSNAYLHRGEQIRQPKPTFKFPREGVLAELLSSDAEPFPSGQTALVQKKLDGCTTLLAGIHWVFEVCSADFPLCQWRSYVCVTCPSWETDSSLLEHLYSLEHVNACQAKSIALPRNNTIMGRIKLRVDPGYLEKYWPGYRRITVALSTVQNPLASSHHPREKMLESGLHNYGKGPAISESWRASTNESWRTHQNVVQSPLNPIQPLPKASALSSTTVVNPQQPPMLFNPLHSHQKYVGHGQTKMQVETRQYRTGLSNAREWKSSHILDQAERGKRGRSAERDEKKQKHVSRHVEPVKKFAEDRSEKYIKQKEQSKKYSHVDEMDRKRGDKINGKLSKGKEQSNRHADEKHKRESSKERPLNEKDKKLSKERKKSSQGERANEEVKQKKHRVEIFDKRKGERSKNYTDEYKNDRRQSDELKQHEVDRKSSKEMEQYADRKEKDKKDKEEQEQQKKVNDMNVKRGEEIHQLKKEAISLLMNSTGVEIPAKELPVSIQHQLDQCQQPLVGTDRIYQVCDASYPVSDWQSYLCSICSSWLDQEKLIDHLIGENHRLVYMANNGIRVWDPKCGEFTSINQTPQMLATAALQIVAKTGHPPITKRCSYHVPMAVLEKIWPGYEVSEKAKRTSKESEASDNSHMTEKRSLPNEYDSSKHYPGHQQRSQTRRSPSQHHHPNQSSQYGNILLSQSQKSSGSEEKFTQYSKKSPLPKMVPKSTAETNKQLLNSWDSKAVAFLEKLGMQPTTSTLQTESASSEKQASEPAPSGHLGSSDNSLDVQSGQLQSQIISATPKAQIQIEQFAGKLRSSAQSANLANLMKGDSNGDEMLSAFLGLVGDMPVEQLLVKMFIKEREQKNIQKEQCELMANLLTKTLVKNWEGKNQQQTIQPSQQEVMQLNQQQPVAQNQYDPIPQHTPYMNLHSGLSSGFNNNPAQNELVLDAALNTLAAEHEHSGDRRSGKKEIIYDVLPKAAAHASSSRSARAGSHRRQVVITTSSSRKRHSSGEESPSKVKRPRTSAPSHHSTRSSRTGRRVSSTSALRSYTHAPNRNDPPGNMTPKQIAALQWGKSGNRR